MRVSHRRAQRWARQGRQAGRALIDRLPELTVRLRNSVLAVLVGFVVAYVFSKDLLQWIARPLAEAYAEHPELADSKLRFISLMEVLWTRLSIALWVGIFIASPVIFQQLWMLISPRGADNRRRLSVWFAASSVPLFVGGALFCYYLVLPPVWDFMLGYSTDAAGLLSEGSPVRLAAAITVDQYYSLAKRLMLAFGVVFEIPLILLFLSIVGVVTWRGLWRFNRYWIVLSFVIAAILTPTPDPIAQLLMAVPMVLLYNISILLAWLLERRRDRTPPPSS